MPDASRVFDGFTNLATGVDGGKSASLILNSCVAAASNVTFRGSYSQTRPAWTNHPITVPASIGSRWSGNYQGSEFYDGEGAASGWIISRGGRIFFLDASSFTLKEITVSAFIVVTTPAASPPITITGADQVVIIDVTSESPFSVGETVLINGLVGMTVETGTFIVQNRLTDQIQVKFLGGFTSFPATISHGTQVDDSFGNPVIFYDQNQETDDFAFVFQAENYGIVLAGQHNPLIWDGNSLRRAGINEIPPGILGAYGWGRIWIARPDQRTFVAGNLVGDQSSGTAQLGFRDAILKFTDNLFLAGGGAFSIPINSGKINAFQFLAAQDTSLGNGVLLVGTERTVFSVNAPVDRTTWQNLSYPIQTIALIDFGPLNPRGTVSINGDMWYRAQDGVRSFVTATRYFGDPGNTPQSRELMPVLSNDTENLLFYGSAIYFDNRYIHTISPFRANGSVQHRGLVAINFDLLSDLRQKLPPAWDGAWSGLNMLQVTKGRISNVERGFAFVMGSDIELWEIEKGKALHDTIGGISTRIASWIETRSFPFTSPFLFKKLYMAELFIDNIADDVDITIKWRPDQYPTWTTWATLSFCATVSQCQLQGTINGVCQVFKVDAKQYAARATIGQPPENVCNVVAGMPPLNFGHEFQVRMEWTGKCRPRLFRVHAKNVDESMEGGCQSVPSCVAFPDCGNNYFTYSSYGAIVAPENMVPATATYDSSSHYTFPFVVGRSYVVGLGGAENHFVDPGGNTHNFPGPPFTFTATTASGLFVGQAPNIPVTATVFLIANPSSLIPGGAQYANGQYAISVTPGAFYVLMLGANDGNCINGSTIIGDHFMMGIQAQTNTLVFTSLGAPQVSAILFPASGQNP